jgi:hypothetical protein
VEGLVPELRAFCDGVLVEFPEGLRGVRVELERGIIDIRRGLGCVFC